MSIDWDDYEPFDPGIDGPLHRLTKAEAKAAFERLMAAKDERIRVLGRLLERNGISLASDDGGLQRLDDWFRTKVEPDDNRSGRLRPLWYAVVNDIGLFLGDVIIERAPGIRWVFFDKATNDVSSHRHVLMGFKGAQNPKYNVDVDRLVATYGDRLIRHEQVENDGFLQIVTAAEALAG